MSAHPPTSSCSPSSPEPDAFFTHDGIQYPVRFTSYTPTVSLEELQGPGIPIHLEDLSMEEKEYLSPPLQSFNEYQVEAAKTASYPERLTVHYPIIGVASESGELLEKLKKQLRKGGSLSDPEWIKGIRAELGDVLWYVSQVCTDLQIPLADVAQENLQKLADRRDRGVIIGEGDNR